MPEFTFTFTFADLEYILNEAEIDSNAYDLADFIIDRLTNL